MRPYIRQVRAGHLKVIYLDRAVHVALLQPIRQAGTAQSARQQAAIAMVNKGGRLGALKRYEEELATYAAVDKRFGSASEVTLRQQVALAWLNKGVRLGHLQRFDWRRTRRSIGASAERLRSPCAS